MSGTYRHCKNCENDEDGESVLRCDDCKFFFCYDCSVYKSGFFSSSFHCPRCDSENFTKIGEIENDSPDEDNYTDDNDTYDKEYDYSTDDTQSYKPTNRDYFPNTETYCSKCGQKPGKDTYCGTVNGGHNFTSFSGTVYCKSCGQVPGKDTYCGTRNAGHNFTSFTDTVYCKSCGQIPGKDTYCGPEMQAISLKAFKNYVKK